MMVRPGDLTSTEVLAQRHQHGTRVRYIAGCHCMLCRAANSRYETERALARKNGDWNGIVSAQRARRHLRLLSARGIGRRAVAAACDVSETILHEVKIGRKAFIRARTERSILAVTPAAASDHALVDAARTWRSIDWLVSEGLSKAEIARRLGYPRTIQFNRIRITAKNAMKVERLVARMRVGGSKVAH